MRWFWIDRFTEFVAGQRATALKGVSLAEEVVDEYAPGATHLPASLIVEGMAQTGGLLVSQMSEFQARVVLAKVSSAKFHRVARPGDLLEFRCALTSSLPNGAFVSGTVTCDGAPLADLELMFAMLEDERFANVVLFEPAAFCRMLRLLRLFDVGVYPDGRPVLVPQHMQDAERAELMVF